MGYKMKIVYPEDVRYVWHLVESDVENAAKYSNGTHNADVILQAIMGRRSLLWIITDPDDEPVAHMITEIAQYPLKRVVVVVTAGGRDFKKWQDVGMETLLRYQEEANCDSLEAVCRPGMAKWLSQLGWNKKSTIMEFDHGRKVETISTSRTDGYQCN